MTWIEWKTKYATEIAHEVGFEEKFVDEILSKIQGIIPNDVVPQYHFIDNSGKDRYIDFAIKIDENTILPIELDGKTKFDNYDIFDDTFKRQNNLIEKFGFLLRYSNKRFLTQGNDVIQEISECILKLRDKSSKSNIKDIEISNLKEYTNHLEIELKRLQKNTQKQISISTNENFISLNDDALDLLKEINAKIGKEQKQGYKIYGMILAILVPVVAVLYFALNFSGKPTNTTQVANESPISIDTSSVQYEVKKIDPKGSFVNTKQIIDYENTRQVVCGKMIEIKEFKSGVYLNLDAPYPKNNFYLTIWNDSNLKNLEKFKFKIVCGFGKIVKNRDKFTIYINDKEQFFVK